MNKLTGFLIFAVGVAAGSIPTWYYAKKKHEEEIESIKEHFTYKRPETESIEPEKEEKPQKPEVPDSDRTVTEYAKQLSQEGYTNYSNVEKGQAKEEEANDTNKKDSVPYVITPDEFGGFDDYDRISFTYYADHVLADENDEEVEDIEGSVGVDSLSHFGEYEDDSVYVRNDRLKVDYEILLDRRKYSDILEDRPYLKEDKWE